MVHVVGPGGRLVTGQVTHGAHLHLPRQVGCKDIRTSHQIGSFDMEFPSNLEPLLPFDQHCQRGDAVEMLKDMVKPNLIYGLWRKIQLGDVGRIVGLDLHDVVLVGRVVDIDVSRENLFSAAQVQSQGLTWTPKFPSLQVAQNGR